MLAAIWQRLFGKRARFLAANVAPVTGPPIVRTEWDRWLFLRVDEELVPDEKQQHLALASHDEQACFLALTDRRLLVFRGVQGADAMKSEAHVLAAWPRSAIRDATCEPDLALRLALTDGKSVLFRLASSQRRFTNQWLFARDVAKLLSVERASDVG